MGLGQVCINSHLQVASFFSLSSLGSSASLNLTGWWAFIQLVGLCWLFSPFEDAVQDHPCPSSILLSLDKLSKAKVYFKW